MKREHLYLIDGLVRTGKLRPSCMCLRIWKGGGSVFLRVQNVLDLMTSDRKGWGLRKVGPPLPQGLTQVKMQG